MNSFVSLSFLSFYLLNESCVKLCFFFSSCSCLSSSLFSSLLLFSSCNSSLDSFPGLSSIFFSFCLLIHSFSSSSSIFDLYFLSLLLDMDFLSSPSFFLDLRGHPASTMIDLSSDPHSVPCGSCEFCVREAAVLSVANVAGLTDHHHHHHHVCVQDLGGEAAGLAGGSTTTATLSRSNQMNAYGTLGHHQGNVTFDESLDESNMRSNSRLTLSNKHENSSQLPPSSSLHHHRIHVPVTICLIIIASYIVLGGLMFSRWNPRWSLLDGSFFSFVSLTTVGLSASPSSGEALFSPHGSLFQGSNKRLIACIFYLFIGFALLSMSFHLVYHDVVRRVKRLGRRINQWVSCKASDKSGTDQELTVDSRNPYDSENEGIS